MCDTKPSSLYRPSPSSSSQPLPAVQHNFERLLLAVQLSPILANCGANSAWHGGAGNYFRLFRCCCLLSKLLLQLPCRVQRSSLAHLNNKFVVLPGMDPVCNPDSTKKPQSSKRLSNERTRGPGGCSGVCLGSHNICDGRLKIVHMAEQPVGRPLRAPFARRQCRRCLALHHIAYDRCSLHVYHLQGQAQIPSTVMVMPSQVFFIPQTHAEQFSATMSAISASPHKSAAGLTSGMFLVLDGNCS